MHYTYPFGAPVLPRSPGITESRPVFVLGAYPSAMHVRWRPPSPLSPVQALAVDNEPTPFWDGQGQDSLVTEWLLKVGFQRSWGDIEPAGPMNGTSGRAVDAKVLAPLGLRRDQAWLSDCLDIYHAGKAQARRLEDTYARLRAEPLLLGVHLPDHPVETQIVKRALAQHRQRLNHELALARPRTIITLGNAALRVIKELLGGAQELPDQLNASEASCGRNYVGDLGHSPVVVIPLAHPGAPATFQKAHARWMQLHAIALRARLAPIAD